MSRRPVAPTLPSIPEPSVRDALQRRADATLKPAVAQHPCDVGLFSDDARQLDMLALGAVAQGGRP